MKKWWIMVIVLVVVFAGALIVVVSAERYAGRTEFCGSQCHIMVPNHGTWKKDKHSQPNKETGKVVECIDCHYAPGEKTTLRAKFRGLGQLFSYLATGDKEVRRRAVVNDASCLTANCHPAEKLLTKEIDYKKFYPSEYKGKIKPFLHKTHFEKTIEGQKLHCSSCHVHDAREKHFNVPRESCFLCHLRRAVANEGRAKCAVCHEIPDKEMRAKDVEAEPDQQRKPITHKTLEAAKVPCSSCHIEVMQDVVTLKIDFCVECHHDASPELMGKIGNRKLMHEEHVGKQTARCFQCHEPIGHKKSSYLDAAVQNCAICHAEPHRYTKLLLAGEGSRGLDTQYPSLMHAFSTNCLSCHREEGRDAKGNKVRKASNKACAECHHNDKRYAEMTAKWVEDVREFSVEAKAAEAAAIEAVRQAKGKVPAKVLNKARAELAKGRENLRVAVAGGGVHNKKYAVLLIDMALQSFEETMAMVAVEANTTEGGKE